MLHTRLATPDDTTLWRALRRDGIVRYPSVFIPSLEEHDATPVAQDAENLARGDRVLAFQDTTPIGLAGLNLYPGRASHRAEIGPFYIIPDAQGSGAAATLMDALVTLAPSLGIWQLELAVNEDNPRAIALYLRHGFTQIGRIPNALIGKDGPEHDLLMLRSLPRP